MLRGIANKTNGAARQLRKLASVLHDRRGVSAIEFALIAPVLILAYVGVVELANLLTINRRVSMVASTAADLTAQVKQVSSGNLSDIFAASGKILWPYDSKPLKIMLSSVVADKNNNGKVDWSCSNKGAGRPKNSAYTVPPGLTQADNSVVVAEITYEFKPLLGLDEIFSPGTFEMKRTFYNRPRKSFKVEMTDANCP
jgi:Flp pilus assembly protein TadG